MQPESERPLSLFHHDNGLLLSGPSIKGLDLALLKMVSRATKYGSSKKSKDDVMEDQEELDRPVCAQFLFPFVMITPKEAEMVIQQQTAAVVFGKNSGFSSD